MDMYIYNQYTYREIDRSLSVQLIAIVYASGFRQMQTKTFAKQK